MIPTIDTPRLVLRPFTEADAVPLHVILNETDCLLYFPRPDPPPLERVQRLVANQIKHWQDHHLGWWAVTPKSTGQLAGWCGLQFLPETNEVEVGYLLSHTWWGQGLATEAAQASLDFGFEQLGLHTIIALVHPDNQRSIRVAEKLMMSFVGQEQYFGMRMNKYQRTV